MGIEFLMASWVAALTVRGTCPRCASARVWFNGVRLRKATLLEGGEARHVADVPVRRLKCGDCRSRWSRVADGVVSRCHFQACVVARAVAALAYAVASTLSEIARAQGCHKRTLARFVERVARVGAPAVIARAVVAEAGEPVLPKRPLETRRTRLARVGERNARAGLVVLLLEALGSLRGVEPPALAQAEILMPALVATLPGGGDQASDSDPTGVAARYRHGLASPSSGYQAAPTPSALSTASRISRGR